MIKHKYVETLIFIFIFNKPQISRKIVRWLLLFLKYDFIVVDKLGKTHVIIDALSRLVDSTKPTCVPNQITDAC